MIIKVLPLLEYFHGGVIFFVLSELFNLDTFPDLG
ncbi:hypothetical protein MHOCP_12270 [Moorella humiferrea]|uniref:Uncharacterized protein n=1 Tax=Neomoorella humiferrea TaxID=676965 RepID=A0A2T0AXM3_9FIRM|nr:hypothetical protein MOHU_03310 [Moorella humiferrea]